MMLAFDTPIPFNSMGRRNVSNVPAQSLILMNDPLVAQQSKLWAENIVKTGGDFEERLGIAFLTALGRPPTKSETEKVGESIVSFAEESGEATEKNETEGKVRTEDRVEFWQELCHVIFNMKEFIYVY